MSRKAEVNSQLRMHEDGDPPTRAVSQVPSSSRKASTKAERQEFFLPVSGFVWLYPEEVRIVNHPAFQRLGRVYQLGQTYFVYRGATHKRFEHVIGTLSVVQRMIDAVQHNSEKSTDLSALSESEMRFTRLGALLHDIGHMAAGHTVEDELGLVGRHDADERLQTVFEGEDWKDSQGRTLASLINVEFDLHVPSELAGKGVTASQLVKLLIRKTPSSKTPEPMASERAIVEKSGFRLQVCRDMIGNTICADLLDYLHRDWYHIGKPRPFDERILQYMEIRKQSGAGNYNGADYRFVVSLGRRPKIRTDAISNILELLEWRYQLAESVLFHRTKLAASAMLDRALFELWADSDESIESVLLPLSDEELLSTCRRIALERAKDPKLSEGTRSRASLAAALLRRLGEREIFKHLSTRFYDQLPPDVVAAVERTYGKDPRDPTAPSKRRNTALRLLENDFALDPGSIVMYCPGTVNEKIAEVQIAVGDDVERFCDYEKRHRDQLAGGHLNAQLHRFRSLWRVHFFIKPETPRVLGARLPLLKRAIEKLVLGNLVDDETTDTVVRSFAWELTQIKDSPFRDAEVLEASEIGAYWAASGATGKYPLGAPSIRSYLKASK